MNQNIVRHALLGILLFCLAAFLPACGNQSDWQEQYDLGMRYLTESNYEEAIIALTAAMKSNPKNTDTYIYLAQVYLASGDPETAQQILTQGYDATQDGRLDTSSTDAWFLYNPSLDFDQQLAYRDFQLLSAEQQDTLRQAVAAIKQNQRDTLQTLLSQSSLPPQLFTQLEGEQLEVTILPETNDPLFLKAYETMANQYLEETQTPEEESIIMHFDRIGQILRLTVRPQNGVEYVWSAMDVTYGASYQGQAFDLTMQLDAAQTTDCKDGQYNGDWKTEGFMWMDDQKDSYYYIESSGSAADGKKFEDGPKVFKTVSDGFETVYEYQGDQLIAYYFIDPETGQRVDMLELMDSISNLQEQLGT